MPERGRYLKSDGDDAAEPGHRGIASSTSLRNVSRNLTVWSIYIRLPSGPSPRGSGAGPILLMG